MLKMVNPQDGYGSIPINTIFSGMNIHLPAILMFTRGTRFWPTARWFSDFASTTLLIFWPHRRGHIFGALRPATRASHGVGCGFSIKLLGFRFFFQWKTGNREMSWGVMAFQGKIMKIIYKWGFSSDLTKSFMEIWMGIVHQTWRCEWRLANWHVFFSAGGVLTWGL